MAQEDAGRSRIQVEWRSEQSDYAIRTCPECYVGVYGKDGSDHDEWHRKMDRLIFAGAQSGEGK